MKIVLGLGNPGGDYRSTRHNVGFMVLDLLARRREATFRAEGSLRRYAWCAEIESGPGPLILAKPRTYMNRSGRAAAALCERYDAEPGEMLVVYDDADLALGRLRLRSGGGAGGHRGVRSLIEVLGSKEFLRLRLGVLGAERDETDLADYVLDGFFPEEQAVAAAMIELGADAVEDVWHNGLQPAMNRYNGLRAGDAADENQEEE